VAPNMCKMSVPRNTLCQSEMLEDLECKKNGLRKANPLTAGWMSCVCTYCS